MPDDPLPSIALRPATMRDARRLWTWANDTRARAHSLNSEPIPWADHVEWLERALARQDVLVLVADRGDTSVGVVRFQLRDDAAVVSVNLAPEARGQDLGSRVIRLGTRLAHARWSVPVEAIIRSGNVASIRAFDRAGYRHVADDVVNGIACVKYVAACVPETGASG